MSQRSGESSKTRPALITVGGLVAAVAVLQIGQQVAGVFAPRPAVQVALILAVGSAALVVERIQREDRRWRDRLLIAASLGCVGGLAAVGLLWLFGGFSAASVASVAEQIQAIRDQARASGLVESDYRQVELRPGAHAYAFVFDPAHPGAGMPSSQLRLYEEQQGRLRLQLEFQPARPLGAYVKDAVSGNIAFDPNRRLPYGADFVMTSAADLNKDGQPEILGDFMIESPDTLITVRLPVLIRWSVEQKRYTIMALIRHAPYLGGVVPPQTSIDSSGFTSPLQLHDVRTGATVRGYAVSEYVARHADHDVAVAYIRGYDRGAQVLQLTAWALLALGAPVQECYAGGPSPRVVRIGASARPSANQLSQMLPTGPTGIVQGSSCLMGE